ncbi:flagellar basal body-associated FliL family protein [Sphingorhabdus sp.]|jgi:flagellar protein FliL|uniref:flagellar basal body-associated FliL family protein n=1 Tax=Sphingorhabdus sp. TaxID=1902408 RepID=UPI0040472F4C
MSKAKQVKDATSETSEPSRKSRKLLLGAVIALLLIAGGAAAYFYLTGGFTQKASAVDPRKPKLVARSTEAPDVEKKDKRDTKEAYKEGTIEVKNDRAPVDPFVHEVTYINLPESFTANLADGSGFVQVGLSLATYYDGKVVQNVERQAVPIRSSVLLVLTQQDAGALSTPQGKQFLQRDLTSAINQVLRQKEGFGGIDNVYYTNLVIQ